MLSSFITVALAGVASAATPSGFQPASTKDLFVSFGDTLAVNGVDLPKADTQTAPTIGTLERLTGTYTIMMVDPDIPPRTAGGATTELLHWMQSGLVSANTTTTIGGMKVYELVNPTNTKAFASYIGPSPPNKSPQTHRYTQLLLQASGAGNTTASGNSTRASGGSNSTSSANSMAILARLAMTRSNFSAVNVVRTAGLTILAGNSFDVTATSADTGIGLGNQTIPGAAQASGTTTASSTAEGASSTSTVKPNSAGKVEDGAFIAVLGALAAAIVML